MGRYNSDSGLFTMEEFKNRGIIKMAPDALVFISGDMGTSVVAPVSGKNQKMNFQDGISTINVQNVIDPPGSSTATIEVMTPIYDDRSNYWLTFPGPDGRLYKIPYFTAMMEVKIFFKGRYLVGGEPKYYPAFWGFITSVEESYSGGAYKMSLQCADMLHWWTYINVAYKPSVETNIFAGSKQGLTAYASRFEKANAFEIIYTLVTEMGFENFTTPDWLGKGTPRNTIFPTAGIDVVYGGIIEYWKKRFSTQANLLKMYGATGQLIVDPREPQVINTDNDQRNPKDKTIDTSKSQAATQSRVVANFGIDDRFTRAFQVFHVFDKMGNLESAEYLTKLEIASQVKTAIEYEFFQDVNGNFIFKPPFYNLNTKNIMAYRIKPQEIINYASTLNSDEVVTSLQVQASAQMNIQNEQFPNPVGYHIDLELTKRFGERFKKIVLWYITESGLARSLAAGHLSLMNVKAFSGSVTIPGRPEMRLGYPVYIEHKDMFYYPRSINHTFDYGGSFTTSLSLEGARTRAYGKDDQGKWGVLENYIYKLVNKFNVGPDQPVDKNKTAAQIQEELAKDPDKLQELAYRNMNLIQSLEPGRYEIQKSDTVSMGPNQFDRRTIQIDSVPYSDEEGYKVIGSFKYGRGVVLKAGTVVDGVTMSESDSPNSTGQNVKDSNINQAVTSMRPIAEEESATMASYFQSTQTSDNTNLNVETSIPNYLDLAKESQTPASINQQITQMSSRGSANYTGVPLVNNPTFTNIDTYVKGKNSGSGDANIVPSGSSNAESQQAQPGTTVFSGLGEGLS